MTPSKAPQPRTRRTQTPLEIEVPEYERENERRIRAEERQRVVAEIRQALSDIWPNPTAVGIIWDRINAALDATEGERESGEPDDA